MCKLTILFQLVALRIAHVAPNVDLVSVYRSFSVSRDHSLETPAENAHAILRVKLVPTQFENNTQRC